MAVRPTKTTTAPENKIRAFVEVPGRYAGAVLAFIANVLEPGAHVEHGADNIAERIGDLREVIRRQRTGVIVTNIAAKSQAAKAGMKRGDLLVRYNGKEIDKSETLRALAENTSPSQKVTIDGRRGVEELRLEVHGGRLGITAAGFANAAQTRH